MLLSACGSDNSSGPATPAGFDRADLPALYAEPSAAERQQVVTEWSQRDVAAHDVTIVRLDTVTVGIDSVEVRIVSHNVQADRHYGAVIVPLGAQDVPVLAYTHFSDTGVSVEASLLALGAVAGLRASQFALVLPSYRGKSLSFGADTWTSSGTVSIWDGEVDDALALIHAAWEQPGITRAGTAIFGFSAGGTIALLAAAREPGIEAVVEYFAPVDFFSPWAQGLLLDIIDGRPPPLSSIPDLQESLTDPLVRGELSIADMRLALLRRSALYFADDLPPVLAHHSLIDDVVSVEETRALAAAMGAARAQAWYYEGGGHSPFGLTGSLARTALFLGVLSPADLSFSGRRAQSSLVMGNRSSWESAEETIGSQPSKGWLPPMQ